MDLENQDQFAVLFQKLLNNECLPEEVDNLVEWMASEKTDEASKQLIRDQLAVPVHSNEINEKVRQRLEIHLGAILKEDKPVSKSKVISIKFRKYAAAVLIVMMAGGAYFFIKKESIKEAVKTEAISSRFKNDILPGGNRAILTLANGRNIILDNVHNGTLAQQGNVDVVKLNPGEISYNKLNDLLDEKKSGIFYNTISTPRGGQFQVVLPDGSKVWLNAESSLHFPTAFTGNERKVELTGEGYFEIAKNADMPFKVNVNNAIVEVLGTHFNINAYGDETAMKTTLLEGSVKVLAYEKTQVLKPGEQLTMKNNGFEQLLNNVNTEQVLAWKNGLFDFSDVDLRSIALQLSRWYQVDISFEGNIPDKHISGIISRKNNISTILGMLEFTAGIHSRIDGAKVVFYK